VVDHDGNTSTNTATENVVVNPEAPAVTWLRRRRHRRHGDHAGDAGGHRAQSRRRQQHAGLAGGERDPVGDTLSDDQGNTLHRAGSTSQDVSTWNCRR